MTPTEAKMRVLEKHPEACSEYLSLPKLWEIFPDRVYGRIGYGETEDLAWLSAAEQLKADDRHRHQHHFTRQR